MGMRWMTSGRQPFGRMCRGIAGRAVIFLMVMEVITTSTSAQRWSVELGTGVFNYQGELQSARFTTLGMRPACMLGWRRWIGEGGSVRVIFFSGTLTGQDANNPSYLTRSRNLHFETPLHELSVQGQQRLNAAAHGWFMPFLRAGLGIFRVDPFTRDGLGKRYDLFDLSLEGQGLPEYPGVRIPHRINLSLPVGGGFALRLTETLALQLDLSLRKTFTDQIDGVSGFFPGEEVLMRGRGPKAVELAYRADELAGEDPCFPAEGTMRGNPKTNDWYYGISIGLVWTGNDGLKSYPPHRQLLRPRGWPYRR